MTDDFMSARKAAYRLGVTPATVGRWIRNGRMEAAHLPSGGYVIPIREVERVKAERELTTKTS